MPACRRLVEHAFALHELPSLIEAIFLDKNESRMIESLLGDDAQTFIDVIDEVCPTFICCYHSLNILLIRHLANLISHNGLKRNVSDCCIGCVGTMHSFQEP